MRTFEHLKTVFPSPGLWPTESSCSCGKFICQQVFIEHEGVQGLSSQTAHYGQGLNREARVAPRVNTQPRKCPPGLLWCPGLLWVSKQRGTWSRSQVPGREKRRQASPSHPQLSRSFCCGKSCLCPLNVAKCPEGVMEVDPGLSGLCELCVSAPARPSLHYPMSFLNHRPEQSPASQGPSQVYPAVCPPPTLCPSHRALLSGPQHALVL